MRIKRGRDIFSQFRSLLLIGTKFYCLFPKKFRIWKLNRIRDKKGVFYIALRWMLLKSIAKSLGDNVSIHDHVYLYHPENISFGNNVSIHPMCYIQGSGGISIGNDVSIAHSVTLMTENHNFHDISKPIKDQGVSAHPIVISDNVWIGAKATVLSGKHISSGVIIAAGAVVTKDISENSIVAGVPAKVIRKR